MVYNNTVDCGAETILNWYKRAQTVPIKMSLYHHQQPEALAQDIMDPSFNVFTVNSDPVI